jgi:hypothetical protein
MMKTEPVGKIVLVGYSDDIAHLSSELKDISAEIALVSEMATDADVPTVAGTVLYAVSTDTRASSRLHGVFVYVHDRVQTKAEYIVAIGPIDLGKACFPELEGMPSISIGDLKSLVEREGSSSE